MIVSDSYKSERGNYSFMGLIRLEMFARLASIFLIKFLCYDINNFGKQKNVPSENDDYIMHSFQFPAKLCGIAQSDFRELSIIGKKHFRI